MCIKFNKCKHLVQVEEIDSGITVEEMIAIENDVSVEEMIAMKNDISVQEVTNSYLLKNKCEQPCQACRCSLVIAGVLGC